MTRIRRHIIQTAAVVALMAGGCPCTHAQTPPMTVRAISDSTTLIMGDRTTVNVEVVKNSHNGAMLDMPEPLKDYHGLEMASVTVDSAELGNGRVQLNYRFTFQAFDPSDLLTLPGFTYACDGDTVTSDILTFKILPVDIPEILGNIEQVDSLIINPDMPPVTIKAKFFDWTRSWMLWALLALLLVAAAVTAYILYKKNGPKLFFARKPEPPYDKAIRRLDEMKASGMIRDAQPKQFFSEVTDIFRTYLEERFGIQALEMTSKQIIDEIRRHKEIHVTASMLEQLLQISDFVKFAAMDPTLDERIRTYNTIRDFVVSTRPVEEPDGDTKKRKGSKKGRKDKKKPNKTSK